LQIGDMELARAAAKGDAQAFHALVDRHAASLFRLALSLSGKRADAEDICQEALVGAFKGIARFDGRSSVKTWMTRILLRQAAKNWKKRKRRSAVSMDAPNTSMEPQARAVNSDVGMDLLEVIGRLGPDHQQVVVLREMHGMSYDQIAEAVGIPRSL
jgi:RNA polymerase sigma-70 factor, ECF subfamily